MESKLKNTILKASKVLDKVTGDDTRGTQKFLRKKMKYQYIGKYVEIKEK
jgi:hypothetical protein